MPNVLSHAYSLFFIPIGWLIFYFKPDFGGWSAFSSYFLGMFGGLGLPASNIEFSYTLVRNMLLIAALAFAATPYPREAFLRLREKTADKRSGIALTVVADVALVAIFVLCIVYISSSDYRPNIYFEF
jgi:hypothetical protein